MDVPTDLDGLSPAEYRARYEALQAAARRRAAGAAPVARFAEISDADVVARDSIPAGGYVALRVARGAVLRIDNPAGTPGAALFIWNAEEPSERFNAGDTTKLQWTTVLTTGRVLFSDMGRVLAAITADTGAGHDSIIGPNGPAQTGGRTAGRNGRDNLRAAAAKFGLTRRDVAPALSLFSAVRADAAGRLRFVGPPAGAAVELRAEMNLWVALSNTPHALSPVQQATGPIDYVIARGGASDGLCRDFTEEARRGYINNDAYFAV